MLNLITLVVVLIVVGFLGLLARRIDALRSQVSHVADELATESSATRLYLGRLSGNDPDLVESQKQAAGQGREYGE